MKKFAFTLILALSIFNVKSQQNGIIQIAILFDTSNSMDGLIDQAKNRIWSIVNTMSALRFDGRVPTIEFALYDYGNDNIPSTKNHVRQILPFTSDLDLVSNKLFGLTTRGGEEYCGAVIKTSLEDLNWSSNPYALKQIYIAGNEPFNQGKIDYKEACKLAKKHAVEVNTIYCGDYQQGVKEFWYDGAQCSGGEYANINPDVAIRHYDTPYDTQIKAYNDSINKTYFGYGNLGREKKMEQQIQDVNAESKSSAVFTERAIVKSKKVYKNDAWDIVDASDKDSTLVLKLKEEELPKELKNLNDQEKLEFVEKQKVKRENFQKELGELSKKREDFIKELKAKETDNTESDFGEEIKMQINKKAAEKGFSKVE